MEERSWDGKRDGERDGERDRERDGDLDHEREDGGRMAKGW